MEQILTFAKKIIPRSVFQFFQPMYHWLLAWVAAIVYRFPSRHLTVIGVTGTNGKSTVVHLITTILEEAGKRVVSLSSLRFKVGSVETKNTFKMTMPGRFFIQKLLRSSVADGCTYAVLDVTSEGIKPFRHAGISFDVAVLTNVTTEHIESHGGFQKYQEAKARLFKKTPVHIINGDAASKEYFLGIPAEQHITYSKKDLPSDMALALPGDFNKENYAAAFRAGRFLGVDDMVIRRALERVHVVPGRLEVVQEEPFRVVVDYAHTPDALQKVYQTLTEGSPSSKLLGTSTHTSKLVCVLGSAGGGRDKWKRPEMGKIAAEFCDEIILTNEDPYDEDQNQILSDIETGIFNFRHPISKVMDRREAIHAALKSATPGDTVIITGKGAEPWLMGPGGSKIAWDDRDVAREELKKLY